ncbi:hypothetical protein CHUAL_000428 [Chamberlinius hualienensis]
MKTWEYLTGFLIFIIQIVALIPISTATLPSAYQLCPQTDPTLINVHLIPHSHDDVGWLKTPDEYFYGDRHSIQSAGVQYILDTVIEALEADPQRRFIYVEMSFFYKWWTSRNDSVHQRVINLVNSGQLEFVNGGWSMSDEGGNYYSELIDDMTLGFKFLNDAFGPVAAPKIGWHIDPFGHSRETASIFAQMGLDGIFLGRLDYQNKQTRLNTKTMESVWHASANLGLEAHIFAAALYNEYAAPPGFCFDIVCTDVPIKDNPNLKDYNVDKRVDDFIAYINTQASQYATNNIIITMGEDFQYQDASMNFVNMDKLIKYINERQKTGSLINAFYSTPSCYLLALNQASATWTVKTDDFMPYASDQNSYWTGYYTSRPTFKGLTKYTNTILQTAKHLTAYANVAENNEEKLNVLKRFQADSQHHDSITGTAKQAVNDDYIQSLAIGMTNATDVINNALSELISNGINYPPAYQLCHYSNVSYCDLTQQLASFVITVYNPQGHNVKAHIRVPVSLQSYSVTGPDGFTQVPSQLVTVPQAVLDDPERDGSDVQDLVFNADLPASGFSTFFVQSPSSTISTSQNTEHKVHIPTADLSIQNEFLSVLVDGTTGLLKSITDIVNSKTYNVYQAFYYYNGMEGNNANSTNRASGAYIFRPNGMQIVSPNATIAQYIGTEVQEIHQTFNNYVSQVIRLYPGENKVEMEWMIGPIPILDDIGKEIVTYYSTDLATDGVFYTDSNGREVLQRIRNYRPTWNVNLAEPISGNYYPVNSRIYIKDSVKDAQFTVITDRSQGGSSIQDGDIELMLHRRLLHDDGKGVGEALDEPGVDGKGLRVRGKHWLLVSSIANGGKLHRSEGLTPANAPLVFLSPLISTVPEYTSQFLTTFSGLTTPLPDNVHLLTVEPWNNNTLLLRLEHFYEKTDDPDGLSLPVVVNIQNLFTAFQITSVSETTLGANLLLSDNTRLIWKTNSTSNNNPEIQWERKEIGDPLDITLKPMQIRTFIAQLAYN